LRNKTSRTLVDKVKADPRAYRVGKEQRGLEGRLPCRVTAALMGHSPMSV
jgi:hypothetical protein